MIDICELCAKPEEKTVLLELKNIHSNTAAKFEAGMGVLVKALGYDSERQQKEISPFKSVRDLERLSKSRVERGLLQLYNAICTTWINLEKAKKGTDAFVLDNRIFLNPKSGKPLTNTEWGIIKKDILKTFKHFYAKEEKQIVRYAMALGKVLKGLPLNHALKFGHNTLKNRIIDAAAKLDSPYWHNAITFATQNAGAMIVDLSQRQYKKIHDVIQNSIVLRKTPEELSMVLFDEFGDWNRDWRRIAETEIGNSQNNGQLLTELERREPDEVIFMQGVSSAEACPWCLNKVDGQVVVLLDMPPDGGGDTLKIKGETYTAIWPGKSNYGRSRQNWWVAAGTQHPHTYSKDTEVFTDTGWKLFSDLNICDKIMAIDPNTQNIDFVKYVSFVKHYQDKMVHLSGRNFDLMVTPEHRQLYLSHKTKKLKERSINELIKLNNFDLPRAVGEWSGNYIEQFGLSEEKFARLWAWFISDGCAGIYHGYFRVVIPQKDNTNIKNDLGDLISDSGTIATEIKEMFRKYVGVCANKKYLPAEVKSLSKQGMRWFIDSYSKADGHNRKGKLLHINSFKSIKGTRSDDISLYTTSVELMNDLSEMIIKAGYIPSFIIQPPSNKLFNFPNGKYKSNYDVYIIRVCKSAYRRFDKSMGVGVINIVDYNDFAYDVGLEKWHHLLVRRNGKVAWSGNCRCTWARYLPEFEDAYAKIRESIDQIQVHV
jgi:hypothetical protein